MQTICRLPGSKWVSGFGCPQTKEALEVQPWLVVASLAMLWMVEIEIQKKAPL